MSRDVQQILDCEKARWAARQRASLQSGGREPVLSPPRPKYEMAERTQATLHGGAPVCMRLAVDLDLPQRLNESLSLLKLYRPYRESDHVLSIALNTLCGGRTLDDMELRRNDMPLMDALGVQMLPDPTTAGDFCRRFDEASVMSMMGAINETRLEAWGRAGLARRDRTARIDGDGTLVPTSGECKDGMDISYKGVWGYHPLLVSLSNTQEPLFIKNRPGNRPSSEGVAPLFDEAVKLCRRSGFEDVLLRGDTDFALTRNFDRWTDDGVRFVFGFDARPNMKAWVDAAPEEGFQRLQWAAEAAFAAREKRARPHNVKADIVKARRFRNIRLKSEDIVEFPYRPTRCQREYRVVAVRKNLSIEKGDDVLFDDVRFFFYITNDHDISTEQVVREARDRCHQENLIEQLKNGVAAFRAPSNSLNSNWAYMVMASLAWSLKAWTALLMPDVDEPRAPRAAKKNRILRMDFRTFLNHFIHIPAQVIRTGRRTRIRILAWRPWLLPLFQAAGAG